MMEATHSCTSMAAVAKPMPDVPPTTTAERLTNRSPTCDALNMESVSGRGGQEDDEEGHVADEQVMSGLPLQNPTRGQGEEALLWHTEPAGHSQG